MTNYDLIKNMTIDEMADAFTHFLKKAYKVVDEAFGTELLQIDYFEILKLYKQWLSKEVKQ